MSDYREFQDGEVVPGTRYRVARLIGSGGMGRVYEVEHVELGKRFVLKALQRELSRREDLVARLRNEWRALARLEHPNIVNVTDAGTSSNGVPFYVMERLEGETLSALLHRKRRLLPPHALSITAGILDGLHAAHQIGVVHRDVKPPNIFLIAPSAVKVLDFGIAKIKDAKDVITARGIAVGTPRYMSPEQAQGTGVDARSDIYATGLMLFEMVAGVGPFDDAKDHNELLLAQLGRKAPPLSSISVVAPELEAIVAAMLAKDPRERPSNARQVAETLRALGQRYVHIVGTDAPTMNAPAKPTASAEPPTRVDGPRRSEPARAPTRPDGVAGVRRTTPTDTTTVQPAWEIATTAALPLPQANVTQRLPDVGSPPSQPTGYGADTLVDPLTGAPTQVPAAAPERTEILLNPPLAPGARAHTDPGPTRTAVPLVEAPNLTPPPVVPTASMPPPAPKSPRWGRVLTSLAAVLVVLLGSGVAVVMRRAATFGSAAARAQVETPVANNPSPLVALVKPRPLAEAAPPVVSVAASPVVSVAAPPPAAPAAVRPRKVAALPVSSTPSEPQAPAAASSATARNDPKRPGAPLEPVKPRPAASVGGGTRAKSQLVLPSSGL